MVILCEFEAGLRYMNLTYLKRDKDLREGRKGKETRNLYVIWRKSAFKTVLSSLVKAKRKQDFFFSKLGHVHRDLSKVNPRI